MAQYTIPLRTLIRSNYDLGMNDYAKPDYLTYDEINTRIYNFYYFHEIGFETPEQFAWFLNNRMRLIMPKYVKLFDSELLEIDPLNSFKRVKTANNLMTLTDTENNLINSNIDNSTTNTTDETQARNLDVNTKDTMQNIFKDTQEGLITDPIEDGYATNVTLNDNEQVVEHDESKTINATVAGVNETTSQTTADNNKSSVKSEKVDELEEGYEMAQADLIIKYRASLINVTEMLIAELQDLFMGVYSEPSDGGCDYGNGYNFNDPYYN